MSDYTDDDREALIRILSTKRMHTNESLGAQRADADAILDAGFRRPVRSEPTDAQKARAEGWDAARAEVRMIPCWFNTETGQGGFDLQHGEVASEEGAWMEVNRVLNRNPYRDQERS